MPLGQKTNSPSKAKIGTAAILVDGASGKNGKTGISP